MSRSVKKGPYIDYDSAKKIDALNSQERKEGHQDLVTAIDDFAGNGWPHHGRSRRTQARAHLRQ